MIPKVNNDSKRLHKGHSKMGTLIKIISWRSLRLCGSFSSSRHSLAVPEASIY